ncbi:unnamed protein product [Acanthoscelides obtectus]|uniref:Uncharacterized protein n=1 Tax=Acanthoscelides obtectus TaxID=200917 RepID=A0A9P0JWV6_ACAOB|nr:unnamed protein product [Acanthoscelides obtectus]CAK1647090.1 hypothetical protein AOBTE_LOCUS15040 [Acanthoscelides obtectus]
MFSVLQCVVYFVGVSIWPGVEGYVGNYNDGDQHGFEAIWSWSYVNYTWPTTSSYYKAVVENSRSPVYYFMYFDALKPVMTAYSPLTQGLGAVAHHALVIQEQAQGTLKRFLSYS